MSAEIRAGRLDAGALLAGLTHIAYEDAAFTFCGIPASPGDSDGVLDCPLCIAADEALEDNAGGSEPVDIRALWGHAVVGDFLPWHDGFPCAVPHEDHLCTRAAFHVGQHVATGRGRVEAVWPGEGT